MNEAFIIEKKNWGILGILIFFNLFFYWLLINYGSLSSDDNRQIWAAVYQCLAFFGGFLGIFYSRIWGGHRSYIGRAVLILSIGLLLQCFGQSVYSYFIFYQHIDVPYPSLGDVGFFGSVIAYIVAAAQFAKASGVSLRSKYFENKYGVFLIPLLMLVVTYFVFLANYEFDWTNSTKIFLDFGYPFAEAIYVSIALLALIFCRNLLGGIMKGPIMFLLFAFIFQYFSDFMFLYQSNAGVWSAGGLNDLLYSISYLLMTLGIIYIGQTYVKIKNTQ